MKTKEILSIVILMTLLLFIPNMVNGASTVTLESIEVTSPETGTYMTGEKITIVEKYTDTVVGEPKIRIKFGEAGYEKSITGTINNNVISYEYIVNEIDGGDLTLVSTSESSYLKDSENNTILKPDTLPTLGGSKISVNPVIWTDTQKIKVDLIKENDNTGYNINLKVTELETKEKSNYYYIITENTTKPTIEVSLEGNNAVDTRKMYDKYNVNDYRKYNDLNVDRNIDITNLFEMNNSKLYLWIVEQQRNKATGKFEQKFILESKELNKPEQNKLGSRMKGYFFSDKTSTFLYEPYNHSNKDNRNINVKIGKISDSSILKSIKNGESNCLEKLLEYAKNATSIYEGKIKLGEDSTITDKFDLKQNEYYYVYFELDDENGKYYTVEEVSLYQALVSENVGKNLFDYLSSEFKWNIVEQNKEENKNETPNTEIKDTTTATGKIPQTGESVAIVITIVALLVLATIGIIKFRKNNY